MPSDPQIAEEQAQDAKHEREVADAMAAAERAEEERQRAGGKGGHGDH